MTENVQQPIQFALIGGVDSGKSTLAGQLVAKTMDPRELEKIFKKAKEDGMVRWQWARIFDIFEEEAAKGKTHEYIKVDFTINDKNYQVVDTPGHSIFIRSMIEGVYGVKIAGIIIPMVDNEFEAAFKGFIKEHLIIARASGVEKIILMANKMDLICWDENEYNKKVRIVKDFLQKVGYGPSDVISVPVVGNPGEDLPAIGITDRIGLPEWVKGPIFLESLDIHESICQLSPPIDTVTTFTGKNFILDTRIVNCDSIMTLGFSAVLHIEGKEYPAELIGIKNGDKKYIKNLDKCLTIWALEDSVCIKNDRVLIRSSFTTIGLGKIVKTMEIAQK